MVRGYRVMLISGAGSLHTGRYRIDHKLEMGNILGVQTEVHEFTDLARAFETIEYNDIVIIHRAAHHQALENLIIRAHELGKVVAFDIDDLIFDERDLKYIRALNYWAPDFAASFREGVGRYRKTLELCDLAMTSTDYLAERIERDFGMSAFILRYNLSQELIRISGRAQSEVKKPEGKFRIGYFAGSPVHDWNFRVASQAISRILRDNPSSELFIGGYLNLGNEFEGLGSQILRSPFVDWKELPYLMAPCHVIIAPLESNPHNSSKAETKYIESGILGVPLVASPLDSFRLCVKDGENGYLAEDPGEWYEKINRMIQNRNLVREMGIKAKDHILKYYTPEARAKDYSRILEALYEMRKTRSRRFPVDYVRGLHSAVSSSSAGRVAESIIPPQDRFIQQQPGASPFSKVAELTKLAFRVLRHEGFAALMKAGLRKTRLIINPRRIMQIRPPTQEERRDCPVCYSGMYSQAFAVTPIYESKVTVNYLSCDVCGTVFREKSGVLDYGIFEFYPIKPYLERHLGHPFFAFLLSNLNRYFSLRDSADPSTRTRVSSGRSSGGKVRSLVEVGCATGLFLDMARDAGWRVTGIEPNRKYADWARDSLGLDVITANLESAKLGERFDAVVAIEVIEHSYDPSLFLQHLIRLLKDDAILLLSTPNARSKEFVGKNPAQLTDGGAHSVILNEDSMRLLLKRCGFESLMIRKAEGPYGDQRLVVLTSQRSGLDFEEVFSTRGAYDDNFTIKFLDGYLKRFLGRDIHEQSMRLAAIYRLCEILNAQKDHIQVEKLSNDLLGELDKVGFSRSDLDALTIDKGELEIPEFPSFLPDLLTLRGIALYELGKFVESERAFQQAAALLLDLRKRLSDLTVIWGDEELLASTFLRIGLAKLNSGQSIEAAGVFQRILEEFHSITPALRAQTIFNKTVSLMDMHKTDEAMQELNKMAELVEMDPRNTKLLLTALTILLRQRKAT